MICTLGMDTRLDSPRDHYGDVDCRAELHDFVNSRGWWKREITGLGAAPEYLFALGQQCEASLQRGYVGDDQLCAGDFGRGLVAIGARKQ